MHLRKIKFLVIGKEPNINTNVPLVLISFRIAIVKLLKNKGESHQNSYSLPTALVGFVETASS